jgi:hypothetical protein
MDQETRDPATRIATDGLCRLAAEARHEGLDDTETAVAALNAALALYEHVNGATGERFAKRARRALARAETLRLTDLDARLIGTPRGTA